MNIVKGVADLIRRSSGNPTSEGGSTVHGDKYGAPYPRICFGDAGEEALLNTLWQKYTNELDKVEKKKLLQAFLLQFIQTYENWDPVHSGQTSAELVTEPEDIIIGCSAGHPSEVVLILIQEIVCITSLLAESKNSAGGQGNDDPSEPLGSSDFTADALCALNCLTILTRSTHNCNVFSYYGGVQKITALFKAAVVKLKTLTSSLPVDEHFSNTLLERISFLQKILVRVVSIIFSFMELHTQRTGNIQTDIIRKHPREFSSSGSKKLFCETRIIWQQKAIVMVIEAGGVNWLVELLRVIRRLNLKQQWTDLSLSYLTLGTLKSALCENPRAQNHFRSIGGLDVLLDGLGLPSSNFSFSNKMILSEDDRSGIFQLQLLSLEVLRESVFGNVNNMQFLYENGRIQKFANSICWPAFLLQQCIQRGLDSSISCNQLLSKNYADRPEQIPTAEISIWDSIVSPKLSEWNEYSVKLSRILCSFLLAPEDTRFHHDHDAITQSALPISLAYWELSIRWAMKVFFTVFPCIKACTNESKLPNHIRILASSLQHYILCTFRKVLVSAPALLNIFREEGIWELIFSEKFFYFGSSVEEFRKEIASYSDVLNVPSLSSRPKNVDDLTEVPEVDILQVEAISFLEFVAALQENKSNLPECSVLLDILEQSACMPEISSILLKSLHRILQLAVVQTTAAFNSLDAISRVLKVACIQALELRKLKSSSQYLVDDVNVHTEWISQLTHRWVKCIESSFELFTDYLCLAENGGYLVLHSSSCIDSLFDLFWEENLRRRVLEQILSLLKLPALSSEANRAKSQLCSKFLETFTQAKEREKTFAELAIELLTGMRELILIDQMYYQKLFHSGECFLHILSLLNGSLDASIGEQLVLNILQTLTLLLMGNADLKDSFRALVGVGYQTLQSLLLDFCKWQPNKALLHALLDMLVDGKFDLEENAVVKNEDVIILFLNVLQKCSNLLQHYGLDVLHSMLKDSITNRTACFRAGVLGFLLDWFPVESREDMINKIAQLIQIIGGHSISGKDIRKIFALLRTEKSESLQKHRSLLLTCIQYMLKEKGPEAFFEFNGHDSGILIKSPVQWPNNKGFSFSCWLRLEDIPDNSAVGLFSFLTDSKKGCLAMLAKDMLFFESNNQKRQSILLPINLIPRKWHFLCITHSIGRAFSGGSQLRCYIDGNLLSSEKCRYAKVSEAMTRCSIGTELKSIEEPYPYNFGKTLPFLGQIGPLYSFSDALTSEQIKGLYCLGPSYMYSFLGDGLLLDSQNSVYGGILDAKDGLSSKVIFGLNAQATDGRTLFNVSSNDSSDKNAFEAVIMNGTKLCSRRLLQDIIYCVGGVSVFFPLLTQFKRSGLDRGQFDHSVVGSVASDKFVAEVIELVASVLDGNASNQQQMHLLSGFSILGFLLQSVPPTQLNAETLSSLKYMFYVLRNSGMSDTLIRDVMLPIYLNPHIWVYACYEVQRDLCLFLIQYFESDRSLLPTLCGFPRILDMICQFYWDKAGRSALGSKPLLHPVTKEKIGERPCTEEVRKIRLLLLSLAEMSLRQKISPADIKALIAFFERSHDMVCIEDVLHMIIRALAQKPLLASFLEKTNVLGGCHIFVNLLQREWEPIRLLGLQFLGILLVGLPSEKKGTKFFSLPIGRSKSLPEFYRKGGTSLESISFAISERLFKFPLSDHLSATLFDVLLGGASPKQVLQKRGHPDIQRNKKSSMGFSSHFLLPQILICIFKFLDTCKDSSTRMKILKDLLNLLDSNPSNIEDLMEYGWTSWLETSVRLDVLKYETESNEIADGLNVDELILIKNMYCIVLSHYLYSVKGGWQQLEETVNFLWLNFEKENRTHARFLRGIFEDLIGSLLEISSEDNIFMSQPCRDNTLYLLKLINDLVIIESGDNVLFPILGICSDFSSDNLETENKKDISLAVTEMLNLEGDQLTKISWYFKYISVEDNETEACWWDLYDKTWVIICALHGKWAKISLKVSTAGGPSFGQRARGLVESLNIPAAEMAAVVVSGGISNALGGKANKYIDKAMLLRGEKCPRIIFHLVILYLCKAGLESASRCVQQFISLLPLLLSADDDQSKNRLQFFIWSLVTVRSKYGMLDEGARFHVITHLILEIVSFGKSMLATAILGREDPVEVSSSSKEAGFILSLVQRDRVLSVAVDEAKSVVSINGDRIKQLQELHAKLDEHLLTEKNHQKAFEDDIQCNMNAVLSSDDNRKTALQLALEEEQQVVADKWLHIYRALIDERGPWSSLPFPNSVATHWKLDKTEDSWRRRPKLKRNYKFDERLCHPPTTKMSNRITQPTSESSAGMRTNFPEQMKQFILKGVRGITDEKSLDSLDDDLAMMNELDPHIFLENHGSEFVKDHSGDVDSVPEKEPSSGSTDSDSFEVHLSTLAVFITPKRKLAGHLAIMQNVLHFSGEFLVEGTGGSSVFRNFNDTGNLDSRKSEPLGSIPKQKSHKGLTFDSTRGKGSIDSEDLDVSAQHKCNKIKLHRRWNLSTIKAVHWTRYLLQYTALEIFFNDSKAPVFLNFMSQKDAKHFGTTIISLRNELYPKGSSRDKTGHITFIDRRIALEMAENARERWRRREISNFEYLMTLNTLSGRSYNDLTQYPIFPWVLADYSSEKLDFNKSSTFRDLSKPVGALDSKRFEGFEERYHSFSDPDIPSFYYGSHYSSMGIVLYYLLRLEPFTALHRNLQGGKFDHADRLFQCIDGTYRNCLSNTSDVKELIPEFFYMPEFLVNSNRYHLGVKQDGEPLGDVVLPPWAKGSSEEFIYRNREALESEYVSSNLHHWIDLVFGYKQRGKPAVEVLSIWRTWMICCKNLQ
ncbi:BEACH domain-containing protein B isoform X2 [Zingiber officinale]|uniref:BEACH domain-containing protein B isoform X2 n=1 Tax=Zingiber officinale TaxID=94328 RepID=UPI001C4B2D97|nr:BEACH domain-containing protein B isoform X2 [Zingiber officinale]